jgi:CRISPR-associated protein Cas1
MLANLYLDQLDEVLLDKKYKIIRYADDFVILCKSEKQAEQALQLTEDVLDQLQLCFNQSKTGITHFNRGFRFLGVDFIRSLVFKSKFPADPVKPVKISNEPTYTEQSSKTDKKQTNH